MEFWKINNYEIQKRLEYAFAFTAAKNSYNNLDGLKKEIIDVINELTEKIEILEKKLADKTDN